MRSTLGADTFKRTVRTVRSGRRRTHSLSKRVSARCPSAGETPYKRKRCKVEGAENLLPIGNTRREAT